MGKSFIKIVRQCFPTSHPLSKIFNTNTLKLSYNCLPNVGNIIDGHKRKKKNRKKKRESNSKKEMQEHQLKTCNCRKANQCPLNGKCITKSVIYKAYVTTSDGNEEARTYIRLTKNEFKEDSTGTSIASVTKANGKIPNLVNTYVNWKINRKISTLNGRSCAKPIHMTTDLNDANCVPWKNSTSFTN